MTTPSTGLSDRFSAQVRAALAYKRLGQDDLASGIGISRSTVSRRLRGNGDWPLDEAMRALEFLGYSSFDQFLGAAQVKESA